ncbi:MAG: hypothetical protein LQ346_008879 [Caloplaca aetnensis]|nr:MAG: hypothetical protein LQ346_008879 [Caloplaca aetnensis]
MRQPLPLVELDQTLYDLYSLDGGNPNEIAHVLALAPHPHGSVSSSLPANTKYTVQSPMAPKLDKDIWARICLGNGSQNHAFMSGPISLHLFDIDPPEQDVADGEVESPPAAQTDAHRVYSCLIPSQRPRLSFIPSPAEFKPGAAVKVSAYPPLDFIDDHLCVVSQDVHYGLLSKRDLALSGLPTPPTDVIDGRLSPAEVQDENAVKVESRRIIQAVRDRPLPFVIKFPQSLAGQGVFVIRDHATKASRIQLLETEVPRMIRNLTSSNSHLSPVSLLLQDLVPSDTKNLSLFVTQKGRAVFISCAEQFLDEEGIYRGSILDYQRQEEFEAQHRLTIDQIAAHVHKHGFYGPMGADIMTDQTGKQKIVDLNVRLTGDYMMGPLRGHFYDRRGLGFSYLITPLVILGDRNQFEAKFARELMDGHIIVVGWARGKLGRSGRTVYSVCSVAVGGQDRAGVLELVDRINALALAKPS